MYSWGSLSRLHSASHSSCFCVIFGITQKCIWVGNLFPHGHTGSPRSWSQDALPEEGSVCLLCPPGIAPWTHREKVQIWKASDKPDDRQKWSHILWPSFTSNRANILTCIRLSFRFLSVGSQLRGGKRCHCNPLKITTNTYASEMYLIGKNLYTRSHIFF